MTSYCSPFVETKKSGLVGSVLFAGALFCQSYFDHDDPGEREIRALADSIYRRADWKWVEVRPRMVSHGWDPVTPFLHREQDGLGREVVIPKVVMNGLIMPVQLAGLSVQCQDAV